MPSFSLIFVVPTRSTSCSLLGREGLDFAAAALINQNDA